MAKAFSGKKPQHFGNTIRVFLNYLGRHKFMLGLVGVLTAVSALANLLGTYMIKPVVNGILETGSIPGLVRGVALTAAIYAVGALSTLGYTQTMVRAAQKVLHDIRRDLFAHLQTLPLSFFDSRRNGELMSLFTNDVDTISDALNNSFAMVIQSFIQIAGTLIILYVLNWQLSLIVTVCYLVMFWYVRFSGKRSKAYYTVQQQSLGDLDGYIEEMVAGQKVVKVFNHEAANLKTFHEKNEALRKAVAENYKTVAEFTKLQERHDALDTSLKDVQGKLAAFDGVDVAALKGQITTLTNDLQTERDNRKKDAAAVKLRSTVDTFLSGKHFVNDITRESITDKLVTALGSDDARGKSIDDLFTGLVTDRDGKEIPGILLPITAAWCRRRGAQKNT